MRSQRGYVRSQRCNVRSQKVYVSSQTGYMRPQRCNVRCQTGYILRLKLCIVNSHLVLFSHSKCHSQYGKFPNMEHFKLTHRVSWGIPYTALALPIHFDCFGIVHSIHRRYAFHIGFGSLPLPIQSMWLPHCCPALPLHCCRPLPIHSIC
jgi:hypothetical protein